MKIKKQIEQIEGVELVEKADKGVFLVYLKQKLSNKDLLEIAKEKYPVGTKFIDMEDGAIRTVANQDFMVMQHEVNTPTPESEWDGKSCCSDPFLFLNGQWAEIVQPLFKTEDGVDVYRGDQYWLIADGVDRILTCTANGAHCSDNHFFSSEASAQSWIDAHKPLELVEGEIYTMTSQNHKWIFRFKSIKAKGVANCYTDCKVDSEELTIGDWLIYGGEFNSTKPSSLEEKKQLITAEVNNDYFYGL